MALDAEKSGTAFAGDEPAMGIELRTTDFPDAGVFRPGSLCRWWLEEMEPAKRQDTSYAACLLQVVGVKLKRR